MVLRFERSVEYTFECETQADFNEDPGVAHTLGRHFFWSENLLWRSRITELVSKGMRLTASLAHRDLIVDTPSVGEYLMEGQVPDPVVVADGKEGAAMELEVGGRNQNAGDWKTRQWKGKGVEVLWWDDLDHAQVFDTQEQRAKLVEVLVIYCKG